MNAEQVASELEQVIREMQNPPLVLAADDATHVAEWFVSRANRAAVLLRSPEPQRAQSGEQWRGDPELIGMLQQRLSMRANATHDRPFFPGSAVVEGTTAPELRELLEQSSTALRELYAALTLDSAVPREEKAQSGEAMQALRRTISERQLQIGAARDKAQRAGRDGVANCRQSDIETLEWVLEQLDTLIPAGVPPEVPSDTQRTCWYCEQPCSAEVTMHAGCVEHLRSCALSQGFVLTPPLSVHSPAPEVKP